MRIISNIRHREIRERTDFLVRLGALLVALIAFCWAPLRSSTVEEEGAFAEAVAMDAEVFAESDPEGHAEELLRVARHRDRSGRWAAAEQAYAQIVLLDVPEPVRQKALLEMAQMFGRTGHHVKSVAAYEKFAKLFPTDVRLPEVFMNVGLLYREMGLSDLAIAQFYKVMNSSLRLRIEEFSAYRKTVLRAQIEIADTYYHAGNYSEASAFFGRLMQLDIDPSERDEILFKWAYSHFLLEDTDRAGALLRTFLRDYPDSPLVPEARYLLARCLQKLGRAEEALAETLTLLRSQESGEPMEEANWRYWQRMAGNPIANEFYSQGDYLRALSIYQALARLDDRPQWLWPVVYQIGLCFERLEQPVRAIEAYRYLAEAETNHEEEISPSLTTVIEMARWRKEHLQWQVGNDRQLAELLEATGGVPDVKETSNINTESNP